MIVRRLGHFGLRSQENSTTASSESTTAANEAAIEKAIEAAEAAKAIADEKAKSLKQQALDKQKAIDKANAANAPFDVTKTKQYQASQLDEKLKDLTLPADERKRLMAQIKLMDPQAIFSTSTAWNTDNPVVTEVIHPWDPRHPGYEQWVADQKAAYIAQESFFEREKGALSWGGFILAAFVGAYVLLKD